MSKKLAVIDGDSLCYLCSKDTIQESLSCIDNLLKEILDRTGSTHYYLFLSEGKYFRHKVDPDYKGTRKSSSPLKYLKTLKSYLKEQYLAQAFKGAEADDIVAFVQQCYVDEAIFLDEFTHITICGIDKDVTGQISGHHFNYRTKEFSVTTEAQAEYYLYLQALMGDSTDNIKGIPGVGKVKATRILQEVESYEAVCLCEYQDHFGEVKGLREYAKNFALVYLLRTKEDFADILGYIPDINEPIEIVN